MDKAFLDFVVNKNNDYKKWLPVYSKVLNEYVVFNTKGFNHLRFRTDNTPRNKKEAKYKLGLLPLVRPVIHNAPVFEKYTRRTSPVGGSRKVVLKEIDYWSIVAVVGKQNVKIRVVIRRIGNGQIHFWSVMKLHNKKTHF